MKRFKLNFIMLMVCAIAIVATSCTPEKLTGPDRSLAVATESLSFAYSGGSQDVTINTDFSNWSAQPNVAWLRITKGDGKFTVVALSNDPGRKREATIVVSSGTKRHEIKVEQGGNILSLSGSKLEFDGLAPAGAAEIPSKSVTVEVINKPWTASKAKNTAGVEPAWFNFTQQGDKLVVTVNENPWDSPAREGKIYVEMEPYKDSVIIAQARAPRPLEYFATIKYTGRLINANDDEFALADVKLTGREVDSVRIALVQGPWNATLGADKLHLVPGDQEQEIIDKIVAGTIASVPLKADGSVQRPTSGPGIYTYVVVTYNKKVQKSHAFDTFELVDLGGAPPTIDDFVGSYTLNGTKSMFSNATLPLARPVTIEKGTGENTLIIKGIAYASSVVATFDPVNSTMSIGYQLIDDYVTETLSLVDMEFLTYDGNYSDEAEMIFRLTSTGSLVLTSESEATGYMIYCDEINGGGGGWVNGWYNLSFTPLTSGSLKSSKNEPPIVSSKEFGKR